MREKYRSSLSSESKKDDQSSQIDELQNKLIEEKSKIIRVELEFESARKKYQDDAQKQLALILEENRKLDEALQKAVKEKEDASLASSKITDYQQKLDALKNKTEQQLLEAEQKRLSDLAAKEAERKAASDELANKENERLAAIEARRLAEEEVDNAAERNRRLNERATNAENLSRELSLERIAANDARNLALADADRLQREKADIELERKTALDDLANKDIERLAALNAQRLAEEEVDNAAERNRRLNERATNAENLSRELSLERIAANYARNLALADADRLQREKADIELERKTALDDLANKEIERLAAIAAKKLAEEREAAKEIERANEQSLKDLSLAEAARIQKEKEDAEMAMKLALDSLAALEKESEDLRLNSEKELLEAKLRRDEDLARIEKLQKELEEKSQDTSYKIIRELEKTFKPNYSKSSELLFGDKTDEERNIEIDYYRNHRHKIYQDDNVKLAHTKIDLSEASDEEIIREIAKDRERAVKNSLPKLVAKLIGQKNKESIIEKLSRTDIVIALSVGNSEEFNQWKKDNPDTNIGNTFFGKLKKGSEEQEIRSKAIENLLEGIKGYAAFFGIDDSEEKENLRPNKSPKIHHLSKFNDDSIANKMESRNQSIAGRQRNFSASLLAKSSSRGRGRD